MSDLLKEAIADARAVRETALANAKMALEEAFTPQLKSMLSAKLREDDEEFEDEVPLEQDEIPGDEDELDLESIIKELEDELDDEEEVMEQDDAYDQNVEGSKNSDHIEDLSEQEDDEEETYKKHATETRANKSCGVIKGNKQRSKTDTTKHDREERVATATTFYRGLPVVSPCGHFA